MAASKPAETRTISGSNSRAIGMMMVLWAAWGYVRGRWGVAGGGGGGGGGGLHGGLHGVPKTIFFKLQRGAHQKVSSKILYHAKFQPIQ